MVEKLVGLRQIRHEDVARGVDDHVALAKGTFRRMSVEEMVSQVGSEKGLLVELCSRELETVPHVGELGMQGDLEKHLLFRRGL